MAASGRERAVDGLTIELSLETGTEAVPQANENRRNTALVPQSGGRFGWIAEWPRGICRCRFMTGQMD